MSKTRYQDAEYLQKDQYRDSSNLDARAELHRRFSTNEYGWHEWVFDLLQLEPDSRVLECGCGPGWLWRNNLARIPADCHITLTDLSSGMVTEAAAALTESKMDFQFQPVSIQEMPFADDGFDVVVANHMLYHVPNREKAYGEIRRVLADNGRFFAATNGKQHMIELRQLANLLPKETQEAIRQRPLFSRVDLSFQLENGREELSPWFADVTMRHYNDSLEVTEVDPLINYMLSSSEVQAFVTDDLIDLLRQHVRSVIINKGALHITKDSGLFIAHGIK